MRGFRFFEEYTNATKAQSAGNVIAVQTSDDPFVKEGEICVHALCAYPDDCAPNSPVLARLCSAEYLGRHCERITEARARAVHPKLFEYLDSLA
ncbi:MAG TPA: hypothetical protein VFW98_16295 [Gemmatimonadaceae bacterium]|nr:hypothetical protein [Gemmatimonadaceae bacterium]